jgi:Tfp pilus assembly protein PilN
MIKINLLPKSIYERMVVRNMAILFGVLVVAVIVIAIVYTRLFLVPMVQAKEQDAAAAEDLERQVVAIEKERDEWKAKLPPIQQKLDFIKNVLDYNKKYPKLFEDVAKWTYEKVAYTAMSSDGAQITMTARASSLDDIGRFLLNMYRATDLFTEVTISGVPGYPIGSTEAGGAQVQNIGLGPYGGGGPEANLAGIGAIAYGVRQGPQPRYIGFTVTCKLRTPIVPPAFAGTAATTGAAGQPGAPMPMPQAMPPPGAGPAYPPGTAPAPGGGPGQLP